MLFALRPNAKAYSQVGVETGVAAADPYQLIVLLFDAALLAAREARHAMLAGDIALKGERISRAIRIIEQGLKASVDTTQGGTLAHNLRDLYDYMGMRLLLASARNSTAMLDEVISLLTDLADAWKALRDRGADTLATPSHLAAARA